MIEFTDTLKRDAAIFDIGANEIHKYAFNALLIANAKMTSHLRGAFLYSKVGKESEEDNRLVSIISYTVFGLVMFNEKRVCIRLCKIKSQA